MSLTNTNIPSAASDVVGIFNQSFQQVFSTARPVKCIVDESAKAMEHPVETGTVITDHIIFLPNEIELQMILPADEYRSVYDQIKQLYKAATVLSVQTRTATYRNMFIYRMPHEENTELFNTIPLSLRLRQILIIQTTTQALPPAAVKDPLDQSTINNGLQQPGASLGLPPPASFKSIDQGVPPPSFFGPPDSAGLKLPVGVQPPPPNEESYINYEGKNLPIMPLTTDQLKQIITSKGFPKIGQ